MRWDAKSWRDAVWSTRPCVARSVTRPTGTPELFPLDLAWQCLLVAAKRLCAASPETNYVRLVGPKPVHEEGPHEELESRLRLFRPGGRGSARGVDLDGQRLLLRAGSLPLVRRRQGALPRGLRPQRLQPRDDDHGGQAGPERRPGQPAELAGLEAQDRGRRRARGLRQRRDPGLPPRAGHPAGGDDPQRALQGQRWPRDVCGEPPAPGSGGAPPSIPPPPPPSAPRSPPSRKGPASRASTSPRPLARTSTGR